MSARDEVLGWGLIDWVELDRIHQYVAEENVGQPISVIQSKTLELIESLVSDGMFVLGEVKRDIGFIAWNTSLDESIQRIRDVYVTNFNDPNTWMWFCWLNATEKVCRPLKPLLGVNIRHRTAEQSRGPMLPSLTRRPRSSICNHYSMNPRRGRDVRA